MFDVETSRILTSDVEALKSIIEALRMDMDIVKKTVEKHSGRWKELQAAT